MKFKLGFDSKNLWQKHALHNVQRVDFPIQSGEREKTNFKVLNINHE